MDKKLYLSKRNKVIAGVCGGFAEYFNMDVTLVRIICVVLALMMSVFQLMAVVYIICWAVIPQQPDGPPSGD
ncbi:MAG: PspC domain-containing protein [Clostridiales bacterium]|jgi:phage shock protein C|nr:PspC domain-containing protein [Clostridiales bacterium]